MMEHAAYLEVPVPVTIRLEARQIASRALGRSREPRG